MKVHYINILLFVIPLNILAHNKNKPHTTPHDTQNNRSLCACELYEPANYDNDPQMKSVMENFNKQTQQRFHEYDDRMIEKRKECKDKCDKEIQKIILKDKLEKQMAQQLTTLETKIDTNDIPTCICEKSVADKIEKGCLRCTQNLGGIVAPSSGVLAGIGEAAISVLKPAALEAAAKYAAAKGAAEGLAAGIQAGKNAVIGALQKYFFTEKLGIGQLDSIFTTKYYFDIEKLATAILNGRDTMCGATPSILDGPTCEEIGISIGTIAKTGPRPPPGIEPIVQRLNGLAVKAKGTADFEAAKVTSTTTTNIITEKTGVINTVYGSWETTIIASVVALVVIVLIMVIIYLILRYRRKKKMKKKLQYIKLLEE
ncbi:rifin PIR protein, putative [Plasmodium reichenowi]|uniref:Rifin PIR protein, putative n=1 Tax=Plasmodium reichenowi TaxID=5854 RepID=A0A2P9D4U7_PLARE|nr:rifin PIR protein, putative [Plasmodium reichenowi]